MTNSIRKYIFLLFLIPALVLTKIYIHTPSELDWNIFLFLCIMVVFDQVNLKTFSGFGYAFFNVILSLIIFDRFSIVYGFMYLLVDCLFSILLKKRGSLQSRVSLLSIYIIIIIICNEFYNEYSDMSYFARYCTLLLMLSLSVIFKYLSVLLETGRVTSKLFLDRFGPMLFEIILVFLILAFYNRLEVNLVLILFLSYYTFIGFMHKRFMAVDDNYINSLVKKITEKYRVQIIFMDLQDIKGVFYQSGNIIIIDEKLDYPEQLQTIIHELLHYLTNKMKFPKNIDELIITLFEAVISWYYILTIRQKAEKYWR